jgi:hypothetical protein
MRPLDEVFAHLASFCPIGLVLLGVGGLHPIHIGQRCGGKESQLSSVTGMHEAGFLRYQWGSSPLGGSCGFLELALHWCVQGSLLGDWRVQLEGP